MLRIGTDDRSVSDVSALPIIDVTRERARTVYMGEPDTSDTSPALAGSSNSLPVDVAAGLAQLAAGPPIWPVRSRAGSRLRDFHRLAHPDAVLAWDLCRTQPSPPIGGVAVRF